jgi:integrase
VIVLFQSAWNDFRNSTRLVYRLAPLAMMFQFFTGVRIGELCALKFSDIENGIMTVSRMLQKDTGKVVDYTKSHEDREVILVDGPLVIFIESLFRIADLINLPHKC